MAFRDGAARNRIRGMFTMVAWELRLTEGVALSVWHRKAEVTGHCCHMDSGAPLATGGRLLCPTFLRLLDVMVSAIVGALTNCSALNPVHVNSGRSQIAGR